MISAGDLSVDVDAIGVSILGVNMRVQDEFMVKENEMTRSKRDRRRQMTSCTKYE